MEDENGHPIRDHDSTTHLTAFKSPSVFGIGLRRAIRRGIFSANQRVLLIGGDLGLEKLGHDYFSGAVQILDFYHASELFTLLSQALLNYTTRSPSSGTSGAGKSSYPLTGFVRIGVFPIFEMFEFSLQHRCVCPWVFVAFCDVLVV